VVRSCFGLINTQLRAMARGRKSRSSKKVVEEEPGESLSSESEDDVIDDVEAVESEEENDNEEEIDENEDKMEESENEEEDDESEAKLEGSEEEQKSQNAVGTGKRSRTDSLTLPPAKRPNLTKYKVKYTNKQRCLVFASRGINARHRHFMSDVRNLLPHSKKDVKFDTKKEMVYINEICEMESCNSCMYFEQRKQDLFLWLSKCPGGPSAKFHILNGVCRVC